MKHPLLLLFCIMPFSVMAQTPFAVDLRWKIPAGDTLHYLTVMQQIDTLILAPNISDVPMKKSKAKDLEELFEAAEEALNRTLRDIRFVTDLVPGRNDIVHVTVRMLKEKENTDVPSAGKEKNGRKKKKDEQNMETLMEKIRSMIPEVLLRGSVYAGGGIHSFWLDRDQKNILALFFQLPDHPVRIGQSWPLEVHLIQADQNFVCDSSARENRVTLTGVRTTEEDTLADLRYDYMEYLSGQLFIPSTQQKDGGSVGITLKFDYRGKGTFSVTQGKWLKYSGIMTMDQGGVVNSHIRKLYSLREIH